MLIQADIRKVDMEARTAEFIITNETPDRHGSIIPFKGWDLKNYNKNPIVSYNHAALMNGFFEKPDPDLVIGSSSLHLDKEKRQIIGTVTFEDAENNPLAEKMLRKVNKKVLRTASVAFIPDPRSIEHQENGDGSITRIINKKEMIEWSITDLPSNPDATARAWGDALKEIEKKYYFTGGASFSERINAEKQRIMQPLDTTDEVTEEDEKKEAEKKQVETELELFENELKLTEI